MVKEVTNTKKLPKCFGLIPMGRYTSTDLTIISQLSAHPVQNTALTREWLCIYSY